MATYNTAFGALPSPKTLTGTSSTATAVGDEDEERKRNFTQQYQQQQQSQQQQPPTQTFADMQKAGQARPAPPPTQPSQTTPLVQQTAQTLGVAAPAPAMAQPSMIQTLQSQFQPTAPDAAPAPAAAQDVGGGLLTSTAPQQTGGGTPATAGGTDSRFASSEQVEWMKANPTALNAYGEIPDGLVFVPASQGGPGLRFMTAQERQAGQEGNPYVATGIWNDPNQAYLRYTQLPAGTRAIMEQAGTAPQKPATYDSWLTSLQTSPAKGPDPFANGGQRGTGVIYGQGGNVMQQLQGLLGTGTGGGFTPSGAGAPAQFELSPQTRALQDRLNAVLGEMQGAPSVFDTEAYKARLAANEAELQAQYKTERERLDEELAARGLAASTFGGDRMQSLAGSQARALASMRADLLKEASQAQDRRQEMMLRTMADLSGQMGTQEIAAYNANIERYRTSGQLELDAQRLKQDYALRGMDLTLQQARDMVDKDFKNRSLELQLKELVSREALTREEYALRERLGNAQSRNSIIASLMGNIDFSALTPEQINEILKGAGFNITLPPRPPSSGTGAGAGAGGAGGAGGNAGNTGGGNAGGTTPIQIFTLSGLDLSLHPEGQQFVLPDGRRYQKRGNQLIDVVTGSPYTGG